ncbi:MAG: hypothetical protein A3F75_14500 [Betaproteobacteria bacterium RIFCSPLOWO2_12_FULL_64_23]|nr:MAG: hypothetical protein A3F75_14500 [Betaproteobacteria bacterium RIFCSPLOWO2_12_FULL_64_23]
MRNGKLKTLLALALLTAATLASAQFPDRPIKIVVPYPPGGGMDSTARIMQTGLAEILGQQVIVVNTPGAAGVVGTREVARSARDGYTLIYTNNGPGAITPLLQKDAGYDPVKDFAAVSIVAEAPMLLVANTAQLPTVRDVKGLIEFARKNPKKVEYSSAGIGSFGHLATELFAKKAGIELFHVPYKGGGPSALAVLTGEVKMMMTTSTTTAKNGLADEKLRLLGVTSLKPSSLLPGPTISETIPGFEITVWFGLLAPAGTPPDVIAKLNNAISKTLAQPTVQERFINLGFGVAPNTPKEFGDKVAAEVEEWRNVIRDANIQTN